MSSANAMPKKKAEVPAVFWTKILIGLFFMFCFGYIVPPVGTITAMGMRVIGIFIGIIMFFHGLK